MIPREIVLLAYRNIKRRKVRTLLTLLGIAVGITSVVLFISIGEGLKGLVVSSFGDVGNDIMVTSQQGMQRGEPLTREDIERIERMEGVSAVLPREKGFALLQYRNREAFVGVIGVNPSRERKFGVDMASGRFLRSSDRYIAVLGAKRTNMKAEKAQKRNRTYQERKREGRSQLPGFSRREEIVIDTRRPIYLEFTGSEKDERPRRFRISGVLREGSMPGNMFSSPDNAVIVPLQTLKEVMQKEKDEHSQLIVKVENPSKVAEISRKIKAETEDISVMSMKNIVDSVGSFFNVVEVLFLVIGSIALLVAGFGIMNTMLMSVLERTREIGVVKSVGGRRKHVAQLFLTESALIGFLGGILGVILGVVISKALNVAAKFVLTEMVKMPAEELAEIPAIAQVPAWLVLFSLCFSVVVSVIFGLYPAIKASKLSPVEALRYL